MGRKKQVRQHSVKRMVNLKDTKIKKVRTQAEKKEKLKNEQRKNILNIKHRELPQEPSNMFLSYNTALGPPYRILLDTNFLNMSISNKLDIFQKSMDLLLGKCIPYVTECVVAELEKLGHKYRLAIRLTKDPRFERLTCNHKGTYADDCLVQRVKQFRCFIVATCDKDLKRRLRKIPGVPIMFIQSHKYHIERLPEKINQFYKQIFLVNLVLKFRLFFNYNGKSYIRFLKKEIQKKRNQRNSKNQYNR